VTKPIRAIEVSEAMRLCFDTLPPYDKTRYNISMLRAHDDGDCDDAIFVGDEDDFVILATDDNRFYVRPTLDDPTEGYTPMLERGCQAIEALEAGEPLELILPQVKTPCYYGAYVNTCEDAVRLAIQWLSFAPQDLPKIYNPPVVTPR